MTNALPKEGAIKSLNGVLEEMRRVEMTRGTASGHTVFNATVIYLYLPPDFFTIRTFSPFFAFLVKQFEIFNENYTFPSTSRTRTNIEDRFND